MIRVPCRRRRGEYGSGFLLVVLTMAVFMVVVMLVFLSFLIPEFYVTELRFLTELGIREAIAMETKNPAYDSLKRVSELAEARGIEIDRDRSVACPEENFDCECTITQMEDPISSCSRSVRTRYFQVKTVDSRGLVATVLAYAPL